MKREEQNILGKTVVRRKGRWWEIYYNNTDDNRGCATAHVDGDELVLEG